MDGFSLKPMELSVIIPVFNESQNIFPLVERLKPILEEITQEYEIIFVNDGSKDDTLFKIKSLAQTESRIKYIDFTRNFGHQIAVTAGIDVTKGDKIVIIDADLQDPPELIKPMYDKIKEGFEVVYAKRKARKGESFFKKITAKLFYRILNKWSNVDIPLDTGDFRIMTHHIVKVLRQMPEQHKFLRAQISWIGYNQTFIEYERDSRLHGESKYPLTKMMKFALDGITSFSTVPLKFASWLGFTVSFTAFLFIFWVSFVRLIGYKFGLTYQPGWASEMVAILFLGGIQLLGIGVLGEYIGRINENIKNRPLYLVKDHNIENLEK